MDMPEITLAMFSIFNVLRIGSYLPQIIRVAADDEGAKAISYSTWCIWIGVNTTTAAYAIVNITDVVLFLISTLNALGCVTVIGLTAVKRYRLTRGSRCVTVGGV